MPVTVNVKNKSVPASPEFAFVDSGARFDHIACLRFRHSDMYPSDRPPEDEAKWSSRVLEEQFHKRAIKYNMRRDRRKGE